MNKLEQLKELIDMLDREREYRSKKSFDDKSLFIASASPRSIGFIGSLPIDELPAFTKWLEGLTDV